MQIADFVVSENTTIMDAVRLIDHNGRGIVFVCAEDRLKAVLSDGDIRRFIIDQGDMGKNVSCIANYNQYIYSRDYCVA